MAVEKLTRVKFFPALKPPEQHANRKHVLVIGGNCLDTFYSSDGTNKRVEAGGNSVNVSTALIRLGNDATLITPAPTPEIVAAVTNRGADLIALRPEEGEGSPRAIDYQRGRQIRNIHPERAYTIDFHDTELPTYDAMVLSSVDSQQWTKIYKEGSIAAKENDAFLAILPGWTQIENANNTEFFQAAQRADLLCLNRKELMKLLEIRGKETTAEHSLLDLVLLAAKEFGPDKYISVTDEDESVLYTKDDRVLQIERFGERSPTPVGAGDAYAATLTHALVEGETDEDAITYASLNAYQTTQQEDAQSGHQTRDQLQTLRRQNANYQPRIIYSKAA